MSKLEDPVPGAGYVDYVPALVLPAEASTEAGTEAGTETSIYQGLRGADLVEEDARRNSFTYKAADFIICFVGVLFLVLLALALLAL